MRVKIFQNLSSEKPECLTIKNTFKLHFRKFRLKRTKFWKSTHAIPKSDRDWPRVVAKEIMQGSGRICVVMLRVFKKTSKNH